MYFPRYRPNWNTCMDISGTYTPGKQFAKKFQGSPYLFVKMDQCKATVYGSDLTNYWGGIFVARRLTWKQSVEAKVKIDLILALLLHTFFTSSCLFLAAIILSLIFFILLTRMRVSSVDCLFVTARAAKKARVSTRPRSVVNSSLFFQRNDDLS